MHFVMYFIFIVNCIVNLLKTDSYILYILYYSPDIYLQNNH